MSPEAAYSSHETTTTPRQLQHSRTIWEGVTVSDTRQSEGRDQYPRYLYSVLLLLLPLLLAGGCSSYSNSAHRLGPAAEVKSPEYLLRFVEADDEGWLWSPTQATETLDEIRTTAAHVDTFVVIFVHGWHHSAQCCDDNVEGFKETLSQLHTQLSKPRNKAPAGKSSSDDFQLIGIYIGWRGASLPGVFDYLTFWGRKSAAERTGEGDLREFLDRLNQLYRSHNQEPPPSPSTLRTFFGLVTIGHSFGGQVVVRSITAALEQELQGLTAVPAYLRTNQPSQGMISKRPVHGFGDVVILVNPAVESATYQRVRLLSQQLTYSDAQTPVLLTVSADNDYPRGRLFTWGRILGEWFTGKPYNSGENERDCERQALGIYSKNGMQITHRLQPLDDTESLVSKPKTHPPDPYCKKGENCSCQWLEWSHPPRTTALDSLSWDPQSSGSKSFSTTLEVYDFSQQTIFQNVELRPAPGVTAYQPFIVASTHPAIIDGHSGIFSTPFIEFLTRYVGFIEGKEYLLTVEGKASKHTPPVATPPSAAGAY